jgi:RNA polymerase sigma-70 factor (ECF subfamily)
MATGQTGKVIGQIRRAALLGNREGLTDAQLLTRFVTQRDEASFEALVRRHGPMVLGVCLRVLRDPDDAEDAFQAAFLVLVRKAASVGRRELLANWLYGVAHNTALKARAMATRRRAREKQVTAMPEPEAPRPDPARDLLPLLDEELRRLPDKYRLPVVLCDLQGQTRKEAAQQLGWPEGTVSSRLAKARAMLAKRMARDGLAVSAGSVVAGLAPGVSRARVPTSMVSSTVAAASHLVAGRAMGGIVSAKVAALVDGALKAMLIAKLRTLTAVVVLCGVLGAGLGAFGWATSAATPPRERGAPAAAGDAPRSDPAGDEKAPDAKAVAEEVAKLQGTWVMAAVQWKGGKEVGQDVTTDARRLLVIHGTKCVEGQVKGEKGVWFLRVDPTSRPKRLEMGESSEFRPGRVTYGIYELDGDSLKVLWEGDKPEDRPTEMKATGGRETHGAGWVMSWKRVGAGEQPGAKDDKAVPPPVPGAVPLEFDRKITLGAKSEPVKLGKVDLYIVTVGTGTFHLTREGRLTATLNAGVTEHANVDYWVYAAVLDAKGKLLGATSHKEAVERVRERVTPTILRQIELDFGTSKDFTKAAYVVVSISNPDVPEP